MGRYIALAIGVIVCGPFLLDIFQDSVYAIEGIIQVTFRFLKDFIPVAVSVVMAVVVGYWILKHW